MQSTGGYFNNFPVMPVHKEASKESSLEGGDTARENENEE
jgi:hypothetical protein